MRPMVFFFSRGDRFSRQRCECGRVQGRLARDFRSMVARHAEGIERCRRLHEDQEQRIDARSADQRIVGCRPQIRSS